MTSIKILKLAKDRVVSKTYDNSRDTASKMQLKVGGEEVNLDNNIIRPILVYEVYA